MANELIEEMTEDYPLTDSLQESEEDEDPVEYNPDLEDSEEEEEDENSDEEYEDEEYDEDEE